MTIRRALELMVAVTYGITHDAIVTLAIIDYRMPEMDGFEVLEKARVLRPNMAFMLSTPYGTPDVVDDALNLGFNAALSKPFTRHQFGAAVSKALTAVA